MDGVAMYYHDKEPITEECFNFWENGHLNGG